MSEADLVVITGACGGMGRAIARRFAKHCKLLLVDVSEARLSALRCDLPGDASTHAADLSELEAVDKLASRVAELGGLRNLVHTAGLSPAMAEPERLLEVNLATTVRLVDGLEPLVGAGGVAVLVASIAGHGPIRKKEARLAQDILDTGRSAVRPGGWDESRAYATSKYGVIRLCEHRAAAWGRRGARIVSVSPGPTVTPMLDIERRTRGAMLDERLSQTPLNRLAEASDVADAVDFLCSDLASFVSGTDLRVDGGVEGNMRRLRGI